ncbi:hypothetical protein [uncultured Anaerovibrio sp.]|nr:hypothetical protein [uncultured Anaerovibrio sp.]
MSEDNRAGTDNATGLHWVRPGSRLKLFGLCPDHAPVLAAVNGHIIAR